MLNVWLSLFVSLVCSLSCQNGGSLNPLTCQCSCTENWGGTDCSGKIYTTLPDLFSIPQTLNPSVIPECGVQVRISIMKVARSFTFKSEIFARR